MYDVGTVAARVVALAHPFTIPANPPAVPAPIFNRGGANVSDIAVEFTYDVAPDRTVTADVVTFVGTNVHNPSQTFTITNFPAFVGRLSRDHATLTVAHDDAVVETHTFFTGMVQTDVQERICHRSRILLETK
ncbi:MAG: hypothetical protein HYU41_05435 [Candidatus Rokubacteria bacterium]|nr:hypothetical protein [Candidatus Rokubacteria bacterium]